MPRKKRPRRKQSRTSASKQNTARQSLHRPLTVHRKIAHRRRDERIVLKTFTNGKIRAKLEPVRTHLMRTRIGDRPIQNIKNTGRASVLNRLFKATTFNKTVCQKRMARRQVLFATSGGNIKRGSKKKFTVSSSVHCG
jgi:hypothetical protein